MSETIVSKGLEFMKEFLEKHFKTKNFLLVWINLSFLDDYFLNPRS